MLSDGQHTDKILVDMMVQGDRNAFTILYRRHWLSLYDAAYKRLKNPAQVEDILQEIFISLWLKRQEVSIDNLKAYLHTAVRNRVFTFIQRDAALQSIYEPFELLHGQAEQTESRIFEKELMVLIEAYIDTLPEKRKEIFILHLKENISTKEIAERLHISRKTVQNQLNAAYKGLRTGLAPALMMLINHHF